MEQSGASERLASRSCRRLDAPRSKFLERRLERPREQRDAVSRTECCAGDRRLRAEVGLAARRQRFGSGVVDRPLDEVVTPCSRTVRKTPVADRSPNRRVIGHYELLERIPGGGMGVIYRARDVRLRRGRGARSSCLRALSADDRAKARFLLEARAAASPRSSQRLHHSRDRRNRARATCSSPCRSTRAKRSPIASLADRCPVAEALTIAIQVAARPGARS